ncbi:Uncharacterized membrane protein YhaH, DUF805 family [Flavobacterium sp. CF108]|jgi:uncharacterized membrane protein YhaH (DUF805 family)|uniref:DUF805 domain-containing protein n=1 Tax=unclassified Flavobacterium TaxID=196869 RepID=UPI0008B05FCC|nr:MULTISPECIES: DUF805 domain-containing protein [unclassified Flavobacterium]SEP29811.1 Uncharacterized membrane protein YhaH, DUF805 family [Flavobacterium sp. fv08]SHH54302.1 Uncharacterized membrane protein YhaH, DUF805 family [Flavobacterium sp. CF108]
MIEWYKKVVFENYANFNGRARRKEYWMFFLANFIVSFGLGFIMGLLAPSLALIANVYSLAVLVPSIAVGVRRLHDTGKSGWFILIPIYNIILLATEGDKGVNEYGPDPKNEFDEVNEIGKAEL